MKKIYMIILALGAGLTQLSAQSPHFFGVTTSGSGSGMGTIYRTDTNGTNKSLIDTFDLVTNGTRPDPQQLVEVSGKLYGITRTGGNHNSGVFFEFNPTSGIYTVKHHFDDSTGKFPASYLLLAANGKLYGTAQEGGTHNAGTLFEYNVTTGALTRKVSFQTTQDGRYPKGKMVEVSSGVFYGVCQSGGTMNRGTLYKYTLSTNTLSKRDDFNNALTGNNPIGGLMKANNGKLYGMASSGGSNGYGTLFEFDLTADSIDKKVDFILSNGRTPIGNLVEATTGKLYGMTQYGGASSGLGKGVIFEYDITLDTLKRLRSLGSSNLGYYPSGSFVQDSPGKFLILMRTGGPNSFSGVISEYTIATNSLVKKQYFDRTKTGTSPQGNLVKAVSNGKYYGVCNYGGTGDFGVIFEYDKAADTLINKVSFSPSPNGKTPTGTLLKATNGKLYGYTTGGGLGYGTIFEVDPVTQHVVKKADFEGTNGKTPYGALIQAANGKIYGVTVQGGAQNYGVLFEFNSTTGTITKLKDMYSIFAGYSRSGLIEATNGKLYGTTYSGGVGYGVLFEYNIGSNTLTKRDQFERYKGGYPYGRLIQATNGKLYGTTNRGGNYDKGVVYEFDIAVDSIKTLAHFNDTNGSRPQSGLVQTANGKFYGMTTAGNTGTTNQRYGVIYEFDDASDSIKAKANFSRYSTGYGGYGELLEASNGKLYGTSRFTSGGVGGASLVEFDPVTNAFISKSRIYGNTDGGLIELVSPNNASIKEESNPFSQLKVYPNPTNHLLNIDTKGEKVREIKIYSVSGQLMLSLNPTSLAIDVAHLKNGAYIIQVSTDSGVAHSRFIKK